MTGATPPLTQAQAEQLFREGIAALQRGDGATAHARLAPLAAAPAGINPPWLAIAQAAQAVGDDDAAEVALSNLLEREVRSLPGLLLMAGVKARKGDDRAGLSFYRTALAVAGQPGFSVPAALVPLLRAGEAYVQATNARFTAHLEASIADAGLATGAAGARVRQSLDLLLGRQQIYLQQPNMFYFPGLPQRAWFEREEFPWAPALEAATPVIRDELVALMERQHGGFAPYVQSNKERPAAANPLRDDPSWSASFLWNQGLPVEPAASACPRTMEALAAVPIPVIAARSPMALFSVLKPGTHIHPHHGLVNTRLICHLPLIVPDHCGLRVGAETRHWRVGETLIFDDSIEHEAWNRSGETRVVLLFEVWRPEINEAERAALTAMFEAINHYQGPPPSDA